MSPPNSETSASELQEELDDSFILLALNYEVML